MKDIIEKAIQYKRKTIGAYISITKEDICSKITGDKIFVTTKIDGEFNLLYFDGTKSILINSNGKIKDDLALLSSISETLKQQNFKSLTLACELHIKKDDKRCRVSEVMSAIANQQELLMLSAFDILEIDGENFNDDDYENTIAKISKIFSSNEIVKSVDLYILNQSEVEEKYQELVENNGEEGLVVRIKDMPIIYKVKPIHTIDMAIIGYTQAEDEKIREMLLGLLDENGNFVQVGKVGTGLDENQKAILFAELSQNKIDSSYIEADKRRVAFVMVKPTIVVEIAVNEILTQNAKGNIKNHLLSYNQESGYSFISTVNGTSLLHPVFKKIRDDKKVNDHDVRHKQITDIVYIDNTTNTTTEQLPKSEIIFREVYTKSAKGKTNIQKFIAWKTNKETIDDRYPAYVMNYTNFSPTRGEPLKRDVRISSSKEQILELLQTFKDKNIKKGWVLVE